MRIDTINGAPADAVSDGTRYEDLPVDWPSERLALGAEDPTLEAIEWLTPLGRGSRAVIAGGRFAGKSETLRRLLAALASREELEVSAGARRRAAGGDRRSGRRARSRPRPRSASPPRPTPRRRRSSACSRPPSASRPAGGNARRPDRQPRRALAARRPQGARAARNLREGGSLTVIATATGPLGGETTVIALDPRAASTGRQPIVDLIASGTLRPELLVGEDGAEAITRARAAALED